MIEEPWKNKMKIIRAFQDRESEGKVSQEVITLFVRWLRVMEKHEKAGGDPWIDPFFIYLALPEAEQYAFLAEHIDQQIQEIENG